MNHFAKLALVMTILFGLSLSYAHTKTYAAPLKNQTTHLDRLNATLPIQTKTMESTISLGVFGQATQRAILIFQKSHQLPLTGKGDVATLDQLGIQHGVINPPLKFGQKGCDVILLQEKLVELGVLKGRILPSKLTNHPMISSVKVSESTPATQVTTGQHHIKVRATAYTAHCTGCSGITKTGVNLNAHPNQKVVAVDPSLIPLGSTLYIPGYGEAIAADTGSAIQGAHIDVYLQNKQDAKKWGSQTLTITIVN